MQKLIFSFLLIGSIGFSGLSALAGPPKEHPVKSELIADVETVQPGATFHVAVRLTMQPAWHVYWINPGDAGLPTVVQFNVPAGFKLEVLDHPTPVQFDQPGNVVGYGYTESVMIIARVTAPADLKPGATVSLSADAKWLVCKDVCIPGKASPALQLVAGAGGAPANQQVFKDWLERIPLPVEEKAKVTDGRDNAAKVITLQWAEPVKNVQMFAAPGDAWVLRDLKLTSKGTQTVIRFTPEQLDKSVKSVAVPVVLAYDDANGQRRSVRMVQHLGTK